MKVFSRSATIASGDSLSTVINLGEEYNVGIYQILGVQMPDAWTTASLTFTVSADGDTYTPLYWNGELYEIDAAGGAAASRAVSLEPSAFAGWPYVKIRSGKKATPVNQAAERELVVMLGAM